MIKIGLMSDTHGYIMPQVSDFFKDVDEIWHAGDIGGLNTADTLTKLKPLRAVHGNIDDYKTRLTYPEDMFFNVEDVTIYMTHIGGYPDHYMPEVRRILSEKHPNIFISGHSHILKVMYDKKLHLLHLNPGAAGNTGFHKKITMLRFTIDGKEIKDMEIFEKDR